MNTGETSEFETMKVESPAGTTPKVTLANSKLKDSIEVVGRILEAQYAVDDNYLLFVTEGNPYEEALYIYFLDSKLKIKDSLELSADYTSGIVANLSVIDPNTIKFSFFEKKDNWILTILDSPRILFFGNKYPVKRKLSTFRKSWLRLLKS